VQAAVLSLSIWQGGRKVVLIEAGGDGEGDDLIQVPLFSRSSAKIRSEMGLLRSAVHGRVLKSGSTLLTGGVVRALVRWADAPCII